MSSTVRAMVYQAAGEPLVLEELELAAPVGDQVQVRMQASGVCHSDNHVLNGEWPMAGPIVMGHEGAGVVEAVGPLVRDVQVGDHVVLSWFAPCRRCAACASGRAWVCTGTRAMENTLPDGTTPLRRADGSAVAPYLGIGTFAEATVVPESAAIRVPESVPPDVAALIGCAVTTGVGAVVNAAEVRPGDGAVVLGCGGVGQAVVMGLRLVGADPVVAVDLSSSRLETARSLGATHTVRGDDPDLTGTVNAITGGAAFAFEAIGLPALIEKLPDLVGQGGTAVLVGLTATGATAAFEPAALVDAGKSIVGCNYGNSVPSVDFPRLARLYDAGQLPLDRLVGGEVQLAETNRAFDDLRAAVGLRTVIRF